ncbi:MAG: hypothetical protein ACXVEF_03070 [Polyangiales bacterium]
MGDARLLDPAALDKKRTPRGRLSIVVPTKWLREGARLEVDLPAKVRCDLCDGGGCDACGRSGAYRAPEERGPLAVTLPRVSDDVFALRLTNPFGEHEPALLVVRVAGGVESSAGVRWVAPNHDYEPQPGMPALPRIPKVPAWVIWAMLAIVAAVLGYLTRGR